MERMLTNRLKTTVGFIILFVGLELHSRPHLAQVVNRDAVIETALKNSKCPSAKRMTDQDYDEWSKSYNIHDRPAWLEVGPIRFEEEDPTLAFGIVMMASRTEYDYLDFLAGSDEKLVTSFLTKASSCTKAMCVAKKLFGERVGPRMLYLFVNFRFNASNIRYRNVSLFTVDELEDVLVTLRDLPESMLPTHFNRQLIRFARGYTLADYNSDTETVLADSSIKFFDSWSAQSTSHRKITVAHELAHLLATTLEPQRNLDRSKEWFAASSWTVRGNGFVSTAPKHTYVTSYAARSPLEDFAESFAAYRYYPLVLQQTSAAKYRFMKERIFRGHEYLTGCPPRN